MALKLSLNNAQMEVHNTGMLFQGTWYVDDKIKDGLEYASFCAIESGESQNRSYGHKKQAVLVPAGKDIKKKASGVVYTTSPKDMYGRIDDFSDETRLYPYGRRQDTAIGLMKRCVVLVSSTENPKHKEWNTFDIDLGKGSVATGTLTLENGTKELKYGSKISVDGKIGYVVGKTSETVYTVEGLEDNTTKDVKVLCQMDDPLYLNVATSLKPEDKGLFEDSSKLPFTTVPPKSGELCQVVGYIESPIAARIDLNMHIDPIVLG